MNSFLVIGLLVYDNTSIEVVCEWLSKSRETAMNGIAIFGEKNGSYTGEI
jgi:hypothetical protein